MKTCRLFKSSVVQREKSRINVVESLCKIKVLLCDAANVLKAFRASACMKFIRDASALPSALKLCTLSQVLLNESESALGEGALSAWERVLIKCNAILPLFQARESQASR